MATSNPTQPSVWLTSLIWPFSLAYRLALCIVVSWVLAVGLALLFEAFVWEPGSGPAQLNQALMVIVEDTLMGGGKFRDKLGCASVHADVCQCHV